MKRILCLLTMICLTLTACGRGESDNDNNNTDIQSVSLDFTCTTSYSDSGMVYQNESGILHFYDLASGYDTALCSKANCKHEGVIAANPKPTCDGYVEGSCCISYTPPTKRKAAMQTCQQRYCARRIKTAQTEAR